jgi:hypothetical protein
LTNGLWICASEGARALVMYICLLLCWLCVLVQLLNLACLWCLLQVLNLEQSGDSCGSQRDCHSASPWPGLSLFHFITCKQSSCAASLFCV